MMCRTGIWERLTADCSVQIAVFTELSLLGTSQVYSASRFHT